MEDTTKQASNKLLKEIELSNMTNVSEQIGKILSTNKLIMEGYVEITRQEVVAMANAFHKIPYLSTIKITINKDNIYITKEE